jgi:hypothetical protein
MATAIAHQRNIIEIQTPVKFLIRPRTTRFSQKILILSRDPVIKTILKDSQQLDGYCIILLAIQVQFIDNKSFNQESL